MTRDDKRLGRLWTSLGAHARGERVRLPVIDQADAATIADALHQAVDRGTAARAQAIAGQGLRLACAAGCSTCCENLIMTYEPEAVLVADWLARPENAGARATFLAGFARWAEQAGEAAEIISALHGRGRIAEAERAYDEVRDRRVMCALNHEGRCLVYPVRPNVCRNTHALETAERCVAGAAPGPTVMAHEPLDQLMARTHPLLRAAQRALHHGEEWPDAPEALCSAVHRRLTSPPAPRPAPRSRNAPCPCGSGEKLKRCCGS